MESFPPQWYLMALGLLIAVVSFGIQFRSLFSRRAKRERPYKMLCRTYTAGQLRRAEYHDSNRLQYYRRHNLWVACFYAAGVFALGIAALSRVL